MRLRRRRLLAPGMTMAVALGASVLSALALPTGAPHALPVASAASTVAFTDDSDRVAQYTLDGDGVFAPLTTVVPTAFGAAAGTPHEGDVSVTPGDYPVYAFVSTRDNPAGDVYVTEPGTPKNVVRVTCDAGTKAHPVAFAVDTVTTGTTTVSTLEVAYSSTVAGAGNDGHANIWVASVHFSIDSPSAPPSGAPLPTDGPLPPTSAGCGAQVTGRFALPQQSGDNYWPTLKATPPPPLESLPLGVPVLLYTSTRDNPLGDIYAQAASPAAPAAARLTDGGGTYGNSQAVSFWDQENDELRLVFTTTRFRPDGSLASGALVGAGPVPVDSAWDSADPPQSSQPVGYSGDGTAGVLAFSTTAADPYGDVELGTWTLRGAGLIVLPDSVQQVATQPGVAESHPAMLYTPHGSDAPGIDVYVTERTIRAAVTATSTTGGGLRQQVAAANPDDSQPAYSPDGTRVAYSRYVTDGNQVPIARQLVVANADGSDPVVQDVGSGTDLASAIYDYDSQPAWSPDGTRLAFIREQILRDGEFTLIASPPQLYVATVGTTTATALALPGGVSYYDSHPSWSPDGARIVLSRSSAPVDLGVSLYTTTNTGPPKTFTVHAGATNYDFGVAPAATLTITLPAGLVPSGMPAACSQNGGGSGVATVVTCNLGTLSGSGTSDAGADIQFVVNTTATCGAVGYDITEAVSTTAQDVGPSNDTATAHVTWTFADCVKVVGPKSVPVAERAAAIPASVPAEVPASFAAGIRGILGPPGPAGQPELWTVDASTGTGAPLRPAAGKLPVQGTQPSWSPDGLHIAYIALGQLDLATLTADGAAAAVPETAAALSAVTGYDEFVAGSGGAPMPAAAVLASAADPVWTPDGSELVFSGQPLTQPDNSGIYAIAPDGTGLRTIAQAAQPETEPSARAYRDGTVTLTATPGSVLLGQQTTLTATAIDSGNTDLQPGSLTVTLPAGLSVSAADLPAGCTIAAAVVTCAVPALKPGVSATFAFPATGAAVGPQTATADYPVVRDNNPADNTASATVIVSRVAPRADVAVAITLSQPVAYVGGPLTATFTVRNLGPQAAAVTLQTGFTGPLQVTGTPACVAGGSPCALGTVPAGGTQVLTAQVLPKPAGNPTHGYTSTITADVVSPLPDPVPANNTATVTLKVLQPRIQMLPAVQSPGFVSLAYGEDFPPGAAVVLSWQPGITTYGGPFTVAADGTLRAPMLIVGRDVLGTRKIVAKSTTNLFSPVDNTMLVVPRTEAPPGFLERG